MSLYSLRDQVLSFFSLLFFLLSPKFYFILGSGSCKGRGQIQREGSMNGIEMRDVRGTANTKAVKTKRILQYFWLIIDSHRIRKWEGFGISAG